MKIRVTNEYISIHIIFFLKLHIPQLGFSLGAKCKLTRRKIENSIKSFKILPHRLQKIRLIDSITFVNDSKATNIDATDQALKNFKNIYWILGGRIKEKNLQKLKKHFFRIKHVFLVGETKFLYEKYFPRYTSMRYAQK